MTQDRPHETHPAHMQPPRTDDPEVTVIIPAYNQAATISDVIQRASQLPLTVQIIVVDDGSTDATAQIAANFPEAELVRHSRNRGKTASVRTGLSHARGRTIVIQEPDLAYDPADIPDLLATQRDEETILYNTPPVHSRSRLRPLHRA